MKPILFSLAACLFMVAFPSTVEAQLHKSGRSVYAEAFGSGLVMSFSYDQRFSDSPIGLGFRIGVGGMAIGEFANITVPLGINYLAGKDGRYFEAGVGMTYSNLGFLEIEEKLSPLVGTLTFGYRKQPVEGGFMWRIGLTPVFGMNRSSDGNSLYFLPYFPHLGLGYTF